MIVLVRVLALLLLVVLIPFLAWLIFVNLTGREDSRWFGGRPSTLGIRDGKLSGPKQTPNSVVSEGVDPANPAYVAPIAFSGDAKAAMAKLGAVLQSLDRVTLIKVEEGYLYAECRTKTMRFVDDFEARVDAAAGVIHVRSASRLGRRDMGVNRARVEMIRRKFSAS
jgi:uncharacterized protein (DUF1499 family)